MRGARIARRSHTQYQRSVHPGERASNCPARMVGERIRAGRHQMPIGRPHGAREADDVGGQVAAGYDRGGGSDRPRGLELRRRDSEDRRRLRSLSGVVKATSTFPLCLSVKCAPVAQRTERMASDQKPPSAVLRAWGGERNGSGFPLSSPHQEASTLRRVAPLPARLRACV